MVSCSLAMYSVTRARMGWGAEQAGDVEVAIVVSDLISSVQRASSPRGRGTEKHEQVCTESENGR